MTGSTIGAALAGVAPDRPFLVGGDVTVGYGELDARSERVASALLDRGYRRGDRLAIAAPNEIDWLVVFFGAMRIGVVVVTLNVRYRESEFGYMLTQSGARGLVCSARAGDVDFVSFFAGFGPSVPGVTDYFFLGDESGDALLAGSAAVPARPAVEVEPDDPAIILYTSGTTGRPKGAVLTHASLLASARAQAEHLGMDGDVIIGNMPLNHVGGITCNVLASLVSGGCVVLMPAFSPAGTLQLIERHRATIFAGVPTMWVLMLADPIAARVDLGSVRLAVAGGSNLDAALAQRIAARLPEARLVNLYGMSELSGAAIMSGRDDSLDTVITTLGVTIGDLEYRIVDAAGALTEGDGELQVRGASVAAGYWDLPEETAQTFLPDGWLATGDIVAASTDGRHLRFCARAKEMFIQGGYNVYPAEVEGVLTTHPDVAIAAGVGIADPVLGEVGRYFVVLRSGSSLSADELIAYCCERVANYKVPREIVLVGELPLTPAGKVRKAELPRD